MWNPVRSSLQDSLVPMKKHIKYSYEYYYIHIPFLERLRRASLLSNGIATGVRSEAGLLDPLEKIQLLLDDV
jgi:hypothetical protein